MDQNASAALIFSIVAVVLGALGLVGGVIGYVQGTAALRRATLTRQRATSAEEAAVQARAQAEQSARIAQDALDRISRLQVRSLGDVADQPTGPLILPSRVVPQRLTGPIPVEAVPPPPALATGPSVQPTQAAWTSSASEPQPVQSAVPKATAPAPLAESALPAVEAASTPPAQASAEPEAPRVEAASTPPAEPATAAVQATPTTGPSAVQAGTGPIALPATNQDDVGGARHATAGRGEHRGEPVPRTGPTPIGAPPTSGAIPLPPAASEAPDGDGDEAQTAPRSSTGQVTAGAQEAPPMDWAEVLRTGAIPLPSRSRGTYAAPAKRPKGAAGPARFEIRAVGRQRFDAVNVGGEEAQQAAVEGIGEDRHLIRPVESGPVTVKPGGVLAFSVLRVEGREVSVQVTWQRDGAQRTVELAIP